MMTASWSWSWGRLVYPKFLENWDGAVYLGDVPVWKGSCYFAWRNKIKRQNDGKHQDVTAIATTDEDFAASLQGCEELLFDVAGRRFIVQAWRPHYNPDGTFNHTAFDLLEI